MIVVGLTGSIGMGKTTAAGLFAETGAPVFDADGAVRALYQPGGAGTEAVAAAFPDCVGEDGVDRAKLGERVRGDPQAFAKLEALIHPLVAGKRRSFLRRAKRKGAPFVVLDIPLLFETGGDRAVDTVVVVSAPPQIQRARVLSRPGMTEAAFEAILARQTPDSEKRARADFVIDTSGAISETRRNVRRIARTLERRALRNGMVHARDRVRR